MTQARNTSNLVIERVKRTTGQVGGEQQIVSDGKRRIYNEQRADERVVLLKLL